MNDESKLFPDSEQSDEIYGDPRLEESTGNWWIWVLGGLAILILIYSVMRTEQIGEWGTQPKLALRMIGNSELEYYNLHDSTGYATLEQLRDDNWLPVGSTDENLVQNYRLVSQAWQSLNDNDEMEHRFRVIAYPTMRNDHPGLATFAITEDQAVRVYNPNAGADENDLYSWDICEGYETPTEQFFPQTEN